MLYRSLLRKILFQLPAETAHELALHSLSLPFAASLINAVSNNDSKDEAITAIERFGLHFKNPVGLAAGFDKNGIALPALAALGFGFIEAGTVTHHAQPGNKRPRLFRLPEDRALINRAGFNNHGAVEFATRVATHRASCPLGVSIGKSKVTPMDEAIQDYVSSFEAVFSVADYVAINVSSPNTPGLRELQQADQLEKLLAALNAKNDELSELSNRRTRKPLLVKLAPDLAEPELEMIVDVAQRQAMAGIIATNTTVNRTHLRTPAEILNKFGEGGLSGAPLRKRSTEVVAYLYRLTQGRMPLIGVGGIFNSADTWEKICAGASLVQIYTGFIYEGPWIARRITEGLAQLITKNGFRSLDEAIGSQATNLSEV